jgi:outer membrane protein assembly factor BamB
VSCLSADTGETLWHANLVSDLGGAPPNWGYSESVLIAGDMALVTPGGEGGTVVALDKATGAVLWRSDQVKDVAEYSSVVAAEIGGIPQFVQFAKNGVYGLTRDAGRLLWSYRHQKSENSINITTPVVADDSVLVASAYGNGAGLAKVTTANGAQSAQEVYFVKDLDNHHGGLLKVGEYVYGTGSRGLICLRYQTGEIVWQEPSVGKGSLTVADGMLYVLGERHQMALAEATPEGCREHGRFGIENLGRPSWTHPVVANGRLYVRNQQKLTAYDVTAP